MGFGPCAPLGPYDEGYEEAQRKLDAEAEAEEQVAAAMTDDIKDLLTLAAKACGKDTSRWSDDVADWRWRPDLDDGDGARMEAKLRIDVAWDDVEGLVWAEVYGHLPLHEQYADHNNDRQAARRWASFRAAAQIGKGMKT